MPETIALGSVPVTIAVVELLKRSARPPKRWLPLIAVLVGVSLNVAAALIAPSAIALAAAAGLVAGLAAAGLYDTRTVAQ